MKIAIASVEDKIDSQISTKAGRAPFYLIFEDGKLIKTWKNPFAVGGGGAGWAVAKELAKKNVDEIVCGEFGENFIQALEKENIKAVESSKTVKEYIKEKE